MDFKREKRDGIENKEWQCGGKHFYSHKEREMKKSHNEK